MKFWGFLCLDVKKQKINSIHNLTWKTRTQETFYFFSHKELLDKNKK